MKVMQVNVVYKKGSTGKIAYDVHTELKNRGIQSVVCYGRGEGTDEQDVHKTCGELYSKVNHLIANMTGIAYGGCFFSTNRLIAIIKKEKPDIVHLQCINGYFVNIYRLVNWLKKNRIKTVVTLHAEFMYTGGCGHAIECTQWRTHTGCGHAQCPCWHTDMHSWFFDRTGTMWRRMKKAFDGFNNGLVVTSVSPWLKNRAEISPILSDKVHCVVLNGLDTTIFHPYNNEELKKEYGIKTEKVIFHATPYFSTDSNHIKGGCYILKLAKSMANENVKFFIAGDYAPNIDVPDNVVLLGKVTDQYRLASFYSMADVTVLTSRRETFSMITAESLCCGTPVAGFKAGGPESIAIPEFCKFSEYGNIEKIRENILFLLNNKKPEISHIAAQKYDKSVMCENYIKVYQGAFND